MAGAPKIQRKPIATVGKWPPVSAEAASTSPGMPAAAGGDFPQLEGYRLIEPLGQGGMGTVWRAMQLSSNRQVALKLIRGGFFGSPRARARFDREVELLARLEHPHIARLYHSGVYQGTPFYSMELVEGVPLDQYVRSHGLASDAILELVAVIARAIDYAHRKGVIHRDLKPSNILVDAGGSPRIVDFGLGKFLQHEAHTDLSLDGVAAGTLEYMSPEQAAGEHDRVDRGTDVYSFGVVLYELLTDRLPHGPSDSRFELQRSIIEDQPHRPSVLHSAVDRELEALLLKALAKEPAERYASAADLAEDIDSYRRGDPLRARPLTLAYLLRKRVAQYRRHLAVAMLLALALLILGGYAALQVHLARQAAARNYELADRERYTSQIHRAADVLQRGGRDAPEVLQQVPVALRGWEWRHLQSLSDGSFWTIPASVEELALSPVDDELLGVREDGTVAVWSLEMGQAVADVDVREDFGRIVHIAAETNHLVAVRDLQLTILTRLGEVVAAHALPGRARRTAVAPNGEWVVAAVEPDSLLLLAADGGPPQMASLPGGFSAEELDSLSVSNTGVVAIHARRPGPIRVHRAGAFSTVHLELPNESFRGASLTADGGTVILWSTDGLVQAVAVEDRTRRWTARVEGISRAAILPTRDEVWLMSRTGIVAHHASAGTEISSLSGLVAPHSVASGTNGRFIAAADKTSIKIWKRSELPIVQVRFPVNEPAVTAFWRDSSGLTVGGVLGSFFTVRSSGDTKVFPRPVGEPNGITSAAPDGEDGFLIVSQDGRIGRSTGAATTWLGRMSVEEGVPWRSCMDPYARWALGWNARGAFVAWDTLNSTSQPLTRKDGRVIAVATDRDGHKIALATTEDQHVVRILKSGTFDDIERVHVGENVVALALSGDGSTLAAACENGRIAIYDLTEQARLAHIEGQTTHNGLLALDHRGSRLVSGRDLVSLYDTRGGQAIIAFKPPQQPVIATFSPDDQVLAVICSRSIVIRRAPLALKQ